MNIHRRWLDQSYFDPENLRKRATVYASARSNLQRFPGRIRKNWLEEMRVMWADSVDTSWPFYLGDGTDSDAG